MWTPPERIRHPLPETRWPTVEVAAASRLFSPVALGPVTALRRTFVPAMVPWRATEDGAVTAEVLDWYARFATGRPGVIVVEATGIRDVASGPLLRIGDDRFLPGLARLVDVVRAASGGETRLFIQLIDFLAIRRRPEREKFLARHLAITAAHRAAVELDAEAPEDEVRAALARLDEPQLRAAFTPRECEALERGARERVTDLHLAHVRALPMVLPRRFADAADRARRVGFDGVELHYAHAYTMASFLSAQNDRDDGYGGSREARVRLPLEVACAVRERVGAAFAVGARLLGDEIIDGGSRVADAEHYAVALARTGLDYLSFSTGGKFEDAAQPKVGEAVYPYTGRSGYECMPTVRSDARGPFARQVSTVAAVRRAVRGAGFATPIVVAGGIGTFEEAEGILARGDADLVGMARQSLADPDWSEKVRLGRGDEVRRCHYTNYCEALDQRHRQVTCKLWDHVDVTLPGVPLDPTGRRRLVAPLWRR